MDICRWQRHQHRDGRYVKLASRGAKFGLVDVENVLHHGDAKNNKAGVHIRDA
jgi:hypothetical protein